MSEPSSVWPTTELLLCIPRVKASGDVVANPLWLYWPPMRRRASIHPLSWPEPSASIKPGRFSQSMARRLVVSVPPSPVAAHATAVIITVFSLISTEPGVQTQLLDTPSGFASVLTTAMFARGARDNSHMVRHPVLAETTTPIANLSIKVLGSAS